MPARVKVLAAVLITALLMTACFGFKGFRWKVPVFNNGKKNILILDIYPADSGGTGKAYVWVAVGFSDIIFGDPIAGASMPQPRVFDKLGNFGGPYTMVKDDPLRDFIETHNVCGDENDVGGANHKWFLFRTPVAKSDNGRTLRKALTQLGAKINFGPDMKEMLPIDVEIVLGVWGDSPEDGTVGAPDSGEVICTSSIKTSMPVYPESG